MNMTDLFLELLKGSRITKHAANAGLVVQCFDLDELVEFSKVQRALGYDVPLVWLVACEDGFPQPDKLRILKGLASHTAVGCDAYAGIQYMPPLR
jgi:hypothetical protein